MLVITYLILSTVFNNSGISSRWDNIEYVFIVGIVLYLLNNRRKTSKYNDRLKQEHAKAMEDYKYQMEKYYQELEEWKHLYICN